MSSENAAQVLKQSGLPQGIKFALSFMYQTGVFHKTIQFKDADLYDMAADSLERFAEKWDARRGKLKNPKEAKLAEDPSKVLPSNRPTIHDEGVGYKALYPGKNQVVIVDNKKGQQKHSEIPMTEHALYLATHDENQVRNQKKKRAERKRAVRKIEREAKAARQLRQQEEAREREEREAKEEERLRQKEAARLARRAACQKVAADAANERETRRQIRMQQGVQPAPPQTRRKTPPRPKPKKKPEKPAISAEEKASRDAVPPPATKQLANSEPEDEIASGSDNYDDDDF